MAKREVVAWTSPRALIAGFTAVQKPTLDFSKTFEEYQIKVAIDTDEAAPFIKKLEKLRDAHKETILEETDPKKRKGLEKTMKTVDVGTEELDEEGDPTGRTIFRFKQKALIEYKDKQGQPASFTKSVGLVDSKGQAIRKPVKIGEGSTVKVSFEPNPYFSAKDKEVGISFNRLIGVQLISLVEYEGSNDPSAKDMGFGEEEGDFDSSDYTNDEDQNDNDDDDDDEIPF